MAGVITSKKNMKNTALLILSWPNTMQLKLSHNNNSLFHCFHYWKMKLKLPKPSVHKILEQSIQIESATDKNFLSW